MRAASTISDLVNKRHEAEQRIETLDKIRAALERRVGDLEFRCQKVPLLELEKAAAKEQVKQMTEERSKFKMTIAQLEENAKLNSVEVEGPRHLDHQTPLQQPRSFMIDNRFGRGQPSSRTVERSGRSEASAIGRSVASYERIIEQLQDRLVAQEDDDIFDIGRMARDMPFFFQLYSREMRTLAGESLKSEGGETARELGRLASQIKRHIIGRKVADITAVADTDPEERLK